MTALGDRLSAHTATLVVSAACAFACPASAVAADFTWSGATTAPHWSGAANWAGGTAPSGAVGTLSFPALASCPGADTCYRSDNDVSGIAADALSISGGGFYAIGGDGLALGAGGMTISPGSGLVSVDLPLALGADQSWSVAGAQVLLSGAVAGPSRRLRLGLRHGGVVLSGDDEVGALDILGADATEGGATAGENGQVFVGGSLNATDGQPVTVEHALLSGTGAVGPLSSVGGRIVGGGGYVPNPTGLTVDGAVSLDAGSDFAAYVTSPGTGFVPLRATGDVGLGGASLMVALDPLACPTLPVGDTEPLITTTGTVSGNFASLPDGATVVDPGIGCDKQTTYRIHYATHAVTVTVVSDSGGDFTWTGASPGSQGGSWSMASNWAAGTPSGAVDALTFPALSGCPATDACNVGDDDIAGITAHAVTIDFGEGYSMDGEKALRIGAGGLRASTSVASPSGSSLNLPIALAAPQSWTIQGAGDADAGLDLGHGVTGPGQSLGIAFSHAGYLDLETDSEVGAATITGADASLTGEAAGRNGWLQVGSLNASDGNPIGLVDARLDAGSAIGPVTSAGGELGVARGEASGGTLTVAGSASFDAASALFFTLPGSELDATGDVALGGARL